VPALRGEAMGDVDFKDLKTVPNRVAETVALAASSGAHLAGLLKGRGIRGFSALSPLSCHRYPLGLQMRIDAKEMV
jgi:hypothetical protein